MHSPWIVQWNFTRWDHQGKILEGVSGSGPVIYIYIYILIAIVVLLSRVS